MMAQGPVKVRLQAFRVQANGCGKIVNSQTVGLDVELQGTPEEEFKLVELFFY